MEIVFATKNKGKLVEVKSILSEYSIMGMEEMGINIDIVEDGKTFEDNAIIKAKEISKLTGKIAMADDSGIEIDFLDGGPGVYSARYLGEDTSYVIKNQMILDMMADVPKEKRGARYVACIATVFPDGKIVTAHGYLEGEIALASKGSNGFGYDPIFYIPKYNMTGAEMDIEFKNAISHRGEALRKIKEMLEVN